MEELKLRICSRSEFDLFLRAYSWKRVLFYLPWHASTPTAWVYVDKTRAPDVPEDAAKHLVAAWIPKQPYQPNDLFRIPVEADRLIDEVCGGTEFVPDFWRNR